MYAILLLSLLFLLELFFTIVFYHVPRLKGGAWGYDGFHFELALIVHLGDLLVLGAGEIWGWTSYCCVIFLEDVQLSAVSLGGGWVESNADSHDYHESSCHNYDMICSLSPITLSPRTLSSKPALIILSVTPLIKLRCPPLRALLILVSLLGLLPSPILKVFFRS